MIQARKNMLLRLNAHVNARNTSKSKHRIFNVLSTFKIFL